MSWHDECIYCGHKKYCDSIPELYGHHEHMPRLPCVDGKKACPVNYLDVWEEDWHELVGKEL